MATITSANATALDAWVGHTVRVLAQKNDIPLRTVAECIGITPSALTGKLNGQRPWSATEVLALANLFDTDVSRLYDGDGGYVQPPPDFHSAGDDLHRRRLVTSGAGAASTHDYDTDRSCTRADWALAA